MGVLEICFKRKKKPPWNPGWEFALLDEVLVGLMNSGEINTLNTEIQDKIIPLYGEINLLKQAAEGRNAPLARDLKESLKKKIEELIPMLDILSNPSSLRSTKVLNTL
jgi:hypothetical protein